jgi:hypothetical protein
MEPAPAVLAEGAKSSKVDAKETNGFKSAIRLQRF